MSCRSNVCELLSKIFISCQVWEEEGCFHLSRGPVCLSPASVLLSFMEDVLYHVPLRRSFSDIHLYFCLCPRFALETILYSIFVFLQIPLTLAFTSAGLALCHLCWTGTELLSKTMRVLFTTLGAFLFYCIGYMTLPWIAYGIREWRTLLAVLSATSVVYIPLWWYVKHIVK